MKKKPLVMCLTNEVASNFTANVLLAMGAKPAMIAEPSEARELAAKSDATLVNLGTVNRQQAEAMIAAVGSCERHGRPWVLDPVAIQLLDYRREVMAKCLEVSVPTLVRGNQAEIDFLRRHCDALLTGVPLLATGEIDRIYDGKGAVEEIAGGDAMLQTVTATGCAQGAVCAAFLGSGESPLEAARSASRLMKKAGEIAAERAKGPGSFKTALVDAIWELSK